MTRPIATVPRVNLAADHPLERVLAGAGRRNGAAATIESDLPAALVIGMSVHGLALCRALNAAGIRVYALDQDSGSPASATRSAKVIVAQGVNSDRLGTILLHVRRQMESAGPVVLFPSSDKMVRAIATDWDRLAPHYAVSWAETREQVLRLQTKDNLVAASIEAGIDFPRSATIATVSEIEGSLADLRFPLVVKPVRPLSGFKAIRIGASAELLELCQTYAHDLPFVVQEWVEGGDGTLRFCSMLLENGVPLAEFTGRKLRSMPPGTGMGTAMEQFDDPTALALTRKFAASMRLSGPLAVEYKCDPAGRYWMIEPNVGRTEYSVDLIIKSGVNFPVIEYCKAIGLKPDLSQVHPEPTVWIDTERDPASVLTAARAVVAALPRRTRLVLPYFSMDDRAPLKRFMKLRTRRVIGAIAHRVGWWATLQRPAGVDLLPRLDRLPDDARAFLHEQESRSLFVGLSWFEVYEREIGGTEGVITWCSVRNPAGRLIALLPLIRKFENGSVALKVMANYYTPYATVPARLEDAGDVARFRAAMAWLVSTVDRFECGPVAPDDPVIALLERIATGSRLRLLRDYNTTNWFQRITDFESYREGLDPTLRSTLRRKRRKLERDHDLAIRVISAPDELEAALAAYFQVYDRSWKPVEPRPQFIVALSRLAAAKGWLRLGLLEVDGAPAASQIWLVQGSTAYIYKLAYDESFKALSAGTVLTAHMIEHVVRDDGVDRLDYLTGDDRYKRSWMDENRELLTLELVNLWRPLGSYLWLKKRLRGEWRTNAAAARAAG